MRLQHIWYVGIDMNKMSFPTFVSISMFFNVISKYKMSFQRNVESKMKLEKPFPKVKERLSRMSEDH